MKFEEINVEYIEYKLDPLIYFLIDKEVVVYVGKTTRGYSRPFEHDDKVFDTIAALRCNVSELDKLEDKYIMKYQPKYNKNVSTASRKSMPQIKRQVKNLVGMTHLSTGKVQEIVDAAGLELEFFKGDLFISREQFEKLTTILTKVGEVSTFYSSDSTQLNRLCEAIRGVVDEDKK